MEPGGDNPGAPALLGGLNTPLSRQLLQEAALPYQAGESIKEWEGWAGRLLVPRGH